MAFQEKISSSTTSEINCKVLLAQINPIVGDLQGNKQKILAGIVEAKKQQADIVVFPELSLCGYPAEDFLLLPHFIKAVESTWQEIASASKKIIVIVGTPRKSQEGEKPLYNSAALFCNGELVGFHDKCLLPTYDLFDERRYFEPGVQTKIWELNGHRFAVTICEDIWQHSALLKHTSYAFDPVQGLASRHPQFVINISASPFSVGKVKNRIYVCSKAASTLHCPLLLCNQVGGNDGIIFDGHSVYVDGQGCLIHLAKGFQEDFLLVDLAGTTQSTSYTEHQIGELYQALVLGLRDYFKKSGFTKACLGLSGGIDSALVACLAADALGPQNVLGVYMPSRYSSASSKDDAYALAVKLGIQYKEIPIEKPFEEYLDLLTPFFENRPQDVTEENLQARIRGMILMALSNKLGYIVLSTGNKSEMAMGYATLYGDMCGGLGVINDLSKRQVYALAHWINRAGEVIPLSTIQKPPSAELRPNQRDIDTLPEYDVVDNVLEAYVEQHCSPEEIAEKYKYSLDLVRSLIKKIHCNEYKRRQSPPGLRVTEKAFSVGRRFPIVQRWV